MRLTSNRAVQVATLIGVTQARVSQIEHGKITEVDAIPGTSKPSVAPLMSGLSSVTGRSGSPEQAAPRDLCANPCVDVPGCHPAAVLTAQRERCGEPPAWSMMPSRTPSSPHLAVNFP